MKTPQAYIIYFVKALVLPYCTRHGHSLVPSQCRMPPRPSGPRYKVSVPQAMCRTTGEDILVYVHTSNSASANLKPER